MTEQNQQDEPRQSRHIYIARRQTSSLVMLSGGVDSTYALVRLLRDTDHVVYVHHVRLVREDGRHEAELEASRKIVDWCRKNFRAFEYAETAIDHRGLIDPGDGLVAVGFEAGNVALSYFGMHKQPLTYWTHGLCQEKGFDRAHFERMQVCAAGNALPHDPPAFLCLPMLPRAQILADLPKELRDLTWSCTAPTRANGAGWTACGKCDGCALRKKKANKTSKKEEAPESDGPLGAEVLSLEKSPEPWVFKESELNADAPQTTLVMLSGGLDCLYSLVKLLTESKDEVIAHHIHHVNQEGRYVVEAQRTRAIVKWCREHLRPFEYSESAIERLSMPSAGFDVFTVGFEAGIVANAFRRARNRPVHRWIQGWCLEDGGAEKWTERMGFVQACAATNCWPHIAPEAGLLPMVSKRAEMDYLPPELVDLAWTCRRPVKNDNDGWDECGECHTCEIVSKARKARAATDGHASTGSA